MQRHPRPCQTAGLVNAGPVLHHACTMKRSYSLLGTGITELTVMRVALLAECDARTVKTEIRAQLGAGEPVRGRVGERLRQHLKSLGLPSAGAKLETASMHARKKVHGRTTERA